MDNCGGQNNNQMVIRFFLMMAELGYYQTINLCFLVRGHTKNACDRMFILLKQNFHHKNVYTMKKLHENLNSNKHFEVLLANEVDFYNFNGLLSKYYAAPQSGSVNRTHMFSMD